jgi:chlorite dismutase
MSDELEFVDIREKGRSREGKTISSERRLFMQLLVYGGCGDTAPVIEALKQQSLAAVLYEDLNDPQGIGLLIYSEDPDYFLTEARAFLTKPPFSQLTPKPEYTMFGRTYAIGYEDDLDRVLVERPKERVTNPDIPWAIWYPLRRSGQFVHLPAQEQRAILMEHGGIGRAYGRAGLGTDIRLACHGLDKNDNDFVVGLIGAQLFPLSSIVERMRQTKQTSLYLEKLGPFFIGKAVWQGNNA